MELPLDLGLGQGVVLGLILLLAAFVRGYSGFGFSALVVAAGGLITDPVALVPVAILCELAMTVFQAQGVVALVDWRRVVPMLAGAAVAMPPAIWVLARLGTDPARLAISGLILVLSAVLLAGWTVRTPFRTRGHVAVGLASGLATGAAVGGLPVAAFMVAQPIAAPVFRATMVAYLTAIDLVALPLLWVNGLISRDTLVILALALPLLVLGLWAGGRRFLATAPQDFRRMTIRLLLLLSGLGILRSLL